MVPVLVHDGKPISESRIILEFIDETWPENPLFPKNPYERAQTRFWAKFGVDKVAPLISTFSRASAEGVEKAGKEIIEALKIVEEKVIKLNTLSRFHTWANNFKEVPAIKENLPMTSYQPTLQSEERSSKK